MDDNLLSRYLKIHGLLRFTLAITLFTIVVTTPLALHAGFYPEGSWLPGPLWLLKSAATWDRTIGVLFSAALAPVMVFALVFPTKKFLVFFGCWAAVVWIGFGVMLEMSAVV